MDDPRSSGDDQLIGGKGNRDRRNPSYEKKTEHQDFSIPKSVSAESQWLNHDCEKATEERAELVIPIDDDFRDF